MKLVKLYLKNFRGYLETEIEFNEDLNVIIGRNDVGKSTILDALDYFFNESKIEPSDCHIDAEERNITIGVAFKVSDNDFVFLDATNPTTLKDEFLLNEDGFFEIRKVINASNKTITATNVSIEIIAHHPEILSQPLITNNISKLKSLLDDYRTEIPMYSEINKTKKADIRKALFDLLVNQTTVFNKISIPLKSLQDDNMNSWAKVKGNLPIFNLFQSDRTNTDGDKEVQDPMKAITKEALSSLQSDLDRIRDEVVKKVEEIGGSTIEKLKEFNYEIASQLKTLPELKGWDSVFKFSLDTDDDIPLNKRGSGVRRLILLSYFRAQAEKKSTEHNNSNIIYAIEEPETSQHPDFQKMIIESLKKISQQEKSQVFVTTHTPEIAQMINRESLLMIIKDENKNPLLIRDEEIKTRKIIETLGILPTIYTRMVICLEGKHDINFLKNINESIAEFKEIIDLNDSNISLFEMGGSKLIDWINLNHFRDSNIKEFHLYDGDIPKYKQLIDEINNSEDVRRKGICTNRREMENYIPLVLIEEEFGCDLLEFIDIWDDFDVPDHLCKVSYQHISDYKIREKAVKGILNGSVAKKVTKELLEDFGVYEEMKDWFLQMKKMYDSTILEKELI